MQRIISRKVVLHTRHSAPMSVCLAALGGLFLACVATPAYAADPTLPETSMMQGHLLLASAGESALTAPLSIPSTVAANALTAGGGQFGGGSKSFGIALRLGAMVSPRTKFAGGVDITLPALSILSGFSTRIDAEAILSANFKGVSTLFPITFNQVYSKGLIAGNKIYFGGGVGLYISEVTRFGGKVFIGADLATHFGLEADLHFAGSGPALVTAQARLPF